RLAGNRREHNFGRRDRKVAQMVLPDAERVETETIRQDRLLDDVAERLRLCLRRAVRRDGHVSEGIEAEFELCWHPAVKSIARALSFGVRRAVDVTFSGNRELD